MRVPARPWGGPSPCSTVRWAGVSCIVHADGHAGAMNVHMTTKVRQSAPMPVAAAVVGPEGAGDDKDEVSELLVEVFVGAGLCLCLMLGWKLPDALCGCGGGRRAKAGAQSRVEPSARGKGLGAAIKSRPRQQRHMRLRSSDDEECEGSEHVVEM